jgi:hypothetical protein
VQRARRIVDSISVLSDSSTGPSSSPSLMRITCTPSTSSPAMIARWIGAAPRQRGSRDACRLKHPSQALQHLGTDLPVRHDHRRIERHAAKPR